MNNKLLPCPFCGKTETVRCADSAEMGETPLEILTLDYCIVCDYRKGGCGATGGYRKTEKEAIEAWNRRANHGMD